MAAKAREALLEAREAALTDHVIEYGGKPVASVKRAIAAAARRSKVPCSPHVFRHTAAVWMAQADVPMQKISQVLGHTSTRVTETTYARYSPRFMADAMAAWTGSGSSVPYEPIGSIRENGGKLRWAVTGSNRRPSRCKRERPTQICHSLPNQRRDFANLCRFRSLSVAMGGTNGTTRTSRVRPPLCVNRSEGLTITTKGPSHG
jgi:hypothetical protein